MSWNNCKKCIILHRSNFNSALFKVLLTLKLLHGGRGGAKGSTLEDIAMHMIKHFGLDGDIKSQVLATLKYGVRNRFIHRRKEKFSLIMPAAAAQLVPCNYEEEEFERIHCIFPAAWQSNACGDESCGGDQSCCGKRKRAAPRGCGHEEDDEREDRCNVCSAKRPKPASSTCSHRSRPACQSNSCPRTRVPESNCSECFSQASRPRRAPCSQAQKPRCPGQKRRGPPKPLYEDYSQLCEFSDDQNDNGYQFDAHKNCTCCSK